MSYDQIPDDAIPFIQDIIGCPHRGYIDDDWMDAAVNCWSIAVAQKNLAPRNFTPPMRELTRIARNADH